MTNYPLTGSTQTLASLQAGGLATAVAQVGAANSLPAVALQMLASGSYGVTWAYQTADAGVTNFCTGQPVDTAALADQLDQCRAVLSASAQAVADCAAAIAANPGQLTMTVDGVAQSVSGVATLARTWPTSP